MFMSPFLRAASISALVRAGIDRGSAMMDSLIPMMAEGIHRQSWDGKGRGKIDRGHVSKYDPHQGKGEVARRIRQADRDRTNQRQRADNAGIPLAHLSRRGRLVDVA